MSATPREVRDLFYRHWMLSTLPMAVLVLAMLFALEAPWGDPLMLVWLQFVVYLLHEFEEHVLPGGFKDFINHQIAGPMLAKRFPDRVPFPSDFPLDDRAVFWINIVFIWIVFPVGAVAAMRWNLAWGAILPAVGIVNASLHILMGIAKRSYNPGLGVSVVLNIPTGIWTLMVLGDAGVGAAAIVAAFVASIVMHAGLVAWMVLHARKELEADG